MNAEERNALAVELSNRSLKFADVVGGQYEMLSEVEMDCIVSLLRQPDLPTAILEAENAKLEEAARCAENPGFIQARDTEWDMGVNYAKPFIAAAIRSLISKKEPVDLVGIGTAALERGLNSKPKD